MSRHRQRGPAGGRAAHRLVAVPAVGLAVLALITAASYGMPDRAGTGSTPAGARPAARPARTPAPYVHAFAEQPGVLRQAPWPSATTVYSEAAEADGCDHNYGVPGQCVPWTFPPGVTDRCAWLAVHGFGPLVVAGRDHQRLDANHDGVACGRGDG